MSFYNYAYKLASNSHDDVPLKLDYVVKKTKPEVITRNVEPLEAAHLEKILETVDYAVSVDAYVPNRASNFCSQRHCGYWRECVQQYGGKVKE
jgi:hypothetical protein